MSQSVTFGAVRMRFQLGFFFLQDYWSSLLLYPFPSLFSLLISSRLLFSTLVSPLLFPLRGKLQMTLFPLPFHFLCFLCCNVFSNISCRHGRRLDDWRENRETEGCHEEGNGEKSEHLSDGEGGGCFGNPSWTLRRIRIHKTHAWTEQSINTLTGEESLTLSLFPILFVCILNPFDLLIAGTG